MSIVMFTLTGIGFVFSWLTGFSYGRYFVVAPLLLTAFAVSFGESVVVKVSALLAALLLWGIFSFALFGTVPLVIGIPIEFVLCIIAYVVSFAVRRRNLT